MTPFIGSSVYHAFQKRFCFCRRCTIFTYHHIDAIRTKGNDFSSKFLPGHLLKVQNALFKCRINACSSFSTDMTLTKHDLISLAIANRTYISICSVTLESVEPSTRGASKFASMPMLLIWFFSTEASPIETFSPSFY